MQLKKKSNDTFNIYTAEFSWGQLIALHSALQKDHSGPVLDEIFAELDFYVNELPKPGEEKEKKKEEKGKEPTEKEMLEPDYLERELSAPGAEEMPVEAE